MELMPGDETADVERLRTAFELYAFGEAMMRQRIARQEPQLTPCQIEERLGEWLASRPGAEAGDAEGRSVTWSRPSSVR